MALSSHFGFTLLLLMFILVLHITGAEAQRRRQPEKLLVFGDSYADTGNTAKPLSAAWHEPYGITFPGQPAGRFSDGRVLTDHIASFLGIKSPVPYNLRRNGKKLLPHGIDFAIGGPGEFGAEFRQANLTVQVNRLRKRADGSGSVLQSRLEVFRRRSLLLLQRLYPFPSSQADLPVSFLKLKSPVPDDLRSSGELFPDGMNFAVGGSGVFDTILFQENLTVQINHLQEQITQGVFTKADLLSSVAMVAVSGNDYSGSHTMESLRKFVPKVIDQLKVDLRRLHNMGVAKVAVGNLHPIGCIPSATAAVSHKHCNTTINDVLVSFHNKLLVDAMRDLNKDAGASGSSSPFTIINLHRAFTHVLTRETERFPRILEPCCAGLGSGRSCGDEDINGIKLYKVCSRRDSYFYWDNVHPTQAGWSAIFSALSRRRRSLWQLYI